MNPRNILMIRSHSMGIGDVLRSSAAWASLSQRWPQAKLHLLFLSRHKGYPTETLIQHHHALASAEFMTIKTAHPSDPNAQSIPWTALKKNLKKTIDRIQPDLIIDFEPHGLRTSWITYWLKRQTSPKATTVGIRQFPGRAWFYDLVAPCVEHYQKTHGLTNPMDYTERDYIALAALGIERRGQAIELKLTSVGETKKRAVQDHIKSSTHNGLPVIGLNIGCGTPDAVVRRPPLPALAQALLKLAEVRPYRLLLTGAPFEKDINDLFVRLLNEISTYSQRSAIHILDQTGTQDLLELAGVIAVCDAFISSDSGPYHMAVALQRPTILWLQVWDSSAIHLGSRFKHFLHPHPEDLVQAIESLLDTENSPILNNAA